MLFRVNNNKGSEYFMNYTFTLINDRSCNLRCTYSPLVST
uniref:Uncharacterized protein n=1 Tax=Arundo donax TaxID=35708 RepID=A0A0A9FSK8_ARUDO